MDDIAFDSLLTEWAEWMLSDSASALGYPSRSVEGRLIDDGGLLPRGTACEIRSIFMPATVEMVEQALRCLRAAGMEDRAKALQAHYLYQHQSTMRRAAILSRMLSIRTMRPERYNERVRLAKAAIAGYLVAVADRWTMGVDVKRLGA